jgi:hypothetical protein
MTAVRSVRIAACGRNPASTAGEDASQLSGRVPLSVPGLPDVLSPPDARNRGKRQMIFTHPEPNLVRIELEPLEVATGLQAVAGSYELARGLRAAGEKSAGFAT